MAYARRPFTLLDDCMRGLPFGSSSMAKVSFVPAEPSRRGRGRAEDGLSEFEMASQYYMAQTCDLQQVRCSALFDAPAVSISDLSSEHHVFLPS
jgi:hypothetical protein